MRVTFCASLSAARVRPLSEKAEIGQSSPYGCCMGILIFNDCPAFLAFEEQCSVLRKNSQLSGPESLRHFNRANSVKRVMVRSRESSARKRFACAAPLGDSNRLSPSTSYPPFAARERVQVS